MRNFIFYILAFLTFLPVDVKADNTYTRVTDIEGLTSGGTYVLVAKNGEFWYAATSYDSTNKCFSCSGNLDTQITNERRTLTTSTELLEFVITKVDETYYNVTIGDKYLSASHGQNPILLSDSPINWTVTFSNEEVAIHAYDEDHATYYIGYSGQTERFAYFSSSSAKIYLYKKTTSGPAPVPPAEPVCNATVSVSKVGYATYCNADYGVNFDGTGIKAYRATLNSSNTAVDLEEVTEVPAGEGVILECSGGMENASVPCYNNISAWESEDNILKAAAEEKTVGADEKIYVLAQPDGCDLAFYPLATGAKVKAGLAYLDLTPLGASAKSVKINMRPTGVTHHVVTPSLNGGVTYNLLGQPVASPSKGVYIRNGKRFVQN